MEPLEQEIVYAPSFLVIAELLWAGHCWPASWAERHVQGFRQLCIPSAHPLQRWYPSAPKPLCIILLLYLACFYSALCWQTSRKGAVGYAAFQPMVPCCEAPQVCGQASP